MTNDSFRVMSESKTDPTFIEPQPEPERRWVWALVQVEIPVPQFDTAASLQISPKRDDHPTGQAAGTGIFVDPDRAYLSRPR